MIHVTGPRNSFAHQPLRWQLLLPLASFVALVVAGCSSSKEESFDGPLIVKQRPITPSIYSSELVVGENRFLLGLLDDAGALVIDAKVHLRFYDLNGEQEVMTSEVDAVSRVPARDAGITEIVPHVHADGSTHSHVNAGDNIGYYTAQVEFPRAGDWGVEVSIDSDEPEFTGEVKLRFNVLKRGETPAIGSPAPRSHNLTLADVEDISEIDSSANPEPGFHQATIAHAIEAERPAVVFFGVPGYCTSQLCGPEYEIMRKLYQKHKNDAEFIHVEFYKDPGNPDQEPVETVREWNLRNEPWFFVINSEGLISARFEGPASLKELEAALERVAAVVNHP